MSSSFILSRVSSLMSRNVDLVATRESGIFKTDVKEYLLSEEENNEVMKDLLANCGRVSKFSFRPLKGEVGRDKVYAKDFSIHDELEPARIYSDFFAKDSSYRPSLVYDIDVLSVSDKDLVELGEGYVYRVFLSVHRDMVANRVLTGNRVDRLVKNFPGCAVSGCFGHEELPRILYTFLGDDKHFYRLTDLEVLLDDFKFVAVFNDLVYTLLPGFNDKTGVFSGGNLSDFEGIRGLIDNLDLDTRIVIMEFVQQYLLRNLFENKRYLNHAYVYEGCVEVVEEKAHTTSEMLDNVNGWIEEIFGKSGGKDDIAKDYCDPVLDLFYYHYRLRQASDYLNGDGCFPELEHFKLMGHRSAQSNAGCLKYWTRYFR
jgi:hypothetical protein